MIYTEASRCPSRAMTPLAEPAAALSCPACGGENSSDAIFCANPSCGKALGELRYALEEFRAASNAAERVADRVARSAGHPHFATAHLVGLGLWFLLNSGLLLVMPFDAYPYPLLSILLGVEAALITSFLLISNGRRAAYAEQRAAMDYEVNVRSYRLLRDIDRRLSAIERRLDP